MGHDAAASNVIPSREMGARAAALLLLLVAGCGPNAREASVAVLVVAGPVVVLASALLWLLWRLWQRARPGLGFRWRPFVELGLALSGVGLLATTLPFEGSLTEWLGIALWAVGTSYLTLLLLVWRIRLSAPSGLAWAHGIAATVQFLPALVFAFAGADRGELPEVLVAVWLLPGYAGLVTGPLYAVLLIEALVRWQHARRR